MIRGCHAMYYSSEPDALRTFFRDKLGFTAHDLGAGWLIFDLPEADLGCHPADESNGGTSGTHNVSFYCDDIVESVAKLQAKGVEFTGPVADHGYGLVTHFKVPGNFEIQLYQPKYEKQPKAQTRKKVIKSKPKPKAKKPAAKKSAKKKAGKSRR